MVKDKGETAMRTIENVLKEGKGISTLSPFTGIYFKKPIGNALASQVKKASLRINPKQFHFQYPGEAWKFQLGAAVKWILIGFIILLFTWVGVWYWSMQKDIDQARTIIKASGRMGELMKAAQQDKDGYYFIDFNAPKGDSIQNFKEFRRLNSKTVRVYLGKD